MKLILDQVPHPVEYKQYLSGRISDPTARVQVLILSADNQWYLQKDAIVDPDGTWVARCAFGWPCSQHQFTVVAVTGSRVASSPLAEVPIDCQASMPISVVRSSQMSV